MTLLNLLFNKQMLYALLHKAFLVIMGHLLMIKKNSKLHEETHFEHSVWSLSWWRNSLWLNNKQTSIFGLDLYHVFLIFKYLITRIEYDLISNFNTSICNCIIHHLRKVILSCAMLHCFVNSVPTRLTIKLSKQGHHGVYFPRNSNLNSKTWANESLVLNIAKSVNSHSKHLSKS